MGTSGVDGTAPTAANCPLCVALAAPLLAAREGLYWECPECRLRFLDPGDHLSPAEEHARYRFHRNDPDDPGYRAFVRPLRDRIVGHVRKGARGLDFGAGAGSALAALLRESGLAVTLFDPLFHPDPGALAHTYDFVAVSETAEHFRDPAAEFARLRGLLEDGGLLVVGTLLWSPAVEFESWYYRRDPTHVAFYSEATFRWIAARFGFGDCTVCGPRLIALRA